ncbi:glycosyltransferase involved in cell wall biosynthesis [Christiangramia gaetbulicola]|uniref:Glycosyltransferase involved in cell wall biosynthesis n=1 Tax=Christiangramia gaetbulicola TaxID=703340 RepID=A0A2T6AKZ0_9FLAO|nr:glycosyltransferase [Christiangramia gaetbulicola]PTX44485.1 glycosyltransferase involved in cell wall biosynthesis [Christiangramia gaetbulicola]
MKILFIIGWPLGQGGHINSTYALIKDLRKLEGVHNIVLMAPHGEKADAFKELGVRYIPLKFSRNNVLFALYNFIKILKGITANRISVIHAMDYRGFLAALLNNFFVKKKIVFTKAGGKPLPFFLPYSNALIVFSKELENAYNTNNYFFDLNRIFLIKERLPIDNFKVFKKKSGFDSDFVFIAMRLMKAKKGLLDNLFDELEKVGKPKHGLNIVIAGDGELRGYCQERASLINLKSENGIDFKFLGELNDQDLIYQYYVNSKLTVGHGRGLLEAMALGKAVVLLGFDEKGSVLVNKSNVEHISNYNFSGRKLGQNSVEFSLHRILKQLDDTGFSLKPYERFNKQYIEAEYDSKIGAIKTKDIYHKVLEENKSFVWKNLFWMFNKNKLW